ncbi:MAG: hypothetical protein AAB699_00840 [Patescibacteria group bacterium]
MTTNDWFSLIGSIGLIGAGSLLGSLITVVVTHFLEKGKLKTERQSNLQREIYFKLQEQAGKIFEELEIMRQQVKEMKFWLERGQCEEIKPSTPLIERVLKLWLIQVYFSKDSLRAYNKVANAFNEIISLYYDCRAGRVNLFSDESIQKKMNELHSKFHSEAKSCVDVIHTELAENKKSIL